MLALVVTAPALRRRAARSTLADHPGMRDPVNYTFDPEHFEVRSTYSEARYPWAQLVGLARERARAHCDAHATKNYVVPKRGVDPAVLDRLSSYLTQARQRTASH